MHSTENRFAIGPSNRLFIVVYVSIFQPGNFAGWGSEGVNTRRLSPAWNFRAVI